MLFLAIGQSFIEYHILFSREVIVVSKKNLERKKKKQKNRTSMKSSAKPSPEGC